MHIYYCTLKIRCVNLRKILFIKIDVGIGVKFINKTLIIKVGVDIGAKLVKKRLIIKICVELIKL